MTKNFTTLFYKIIGLPIFLFAFASCTKDIQEKASDSQIISSARTSGGTKPGTVSPVYLSVTVSDNVDGLPGYKITSDGKGAYVHGRENVSAYFDQHGNLQFDTNPPVKRTRSTAVRWLNFSFSDPFEGPQDPAMANISTNPKGNYRMVSQNDGQTPAQNLPGSQTIKLGGGFGDGTSTDWNFSFRYNNVVNTSYATITRVDSNTWTITSAVDSPVARLLSNGTVIGFYKLPFKLTLTRQEALLN